MKTAFVQIDSNGKKTPKKKRPWPYIQFHNEVKKILLNVSLLWKGSEPRGRLYSFWTSDSLRKLALTKRFPRILKAGFYIIVHSDTKYHSLANTLDCRKSILLWLSGKPFIITLLKCPELLWYVHTQMHTCPHTSCCIALSFISSSSWSCRLRYLLLCSTNLFFF